VTPREGLRGGTEPTSPGVATPSRWVRLAIRLYPAAWRDRYGDEFGALLEETPMSIPVAFDVLVAAVDAHVHPAGPHRRWPLMIERIRRSELAVFASWVVFVVAGLAFQRMTEGDPFAPIASSQAAVGVSYAVIGGGAVVSLVAVTIAGVPIALAIARAAIDQRRWRQLALLAVPPIALALWTGLTLFLVSRGDPPSTDPWRLVIFLGWVTSFIVAAIASTVAVGAAALAAEIDGSLYRRASLPALITALAMAAVVLAVAEWGIALAVASPSAFWSSDGILSSSTPLTWLGIVLAMAGATAVAVRCAVEARRSPTG
jgi:hypothetical protein